MEVALSAIQLRNIRPIKTRIQNRDTLWDALWGYPVETPGVRALGLGARALGLGARALGLGAGGSALGLGVKAFGVGATALGLRASSLLCIALSNFLKTCAKNIKKAATTKNDILPPKL